MVNETVLLEIYTEIAEAEGFRGNEYKDHLGYPTIGYGTKLPLTEEEAGILLQHRLRRMIKELTQHKPMIDSLPDKAQVIVINMAYQLGVPRLLKFKKMWQALEHGDFKEASKEMKDSLWNQQTPNRSNRLASIMSDITYV